MQIFFNSGINKHMREHQQIKQILPFHLHKQRKIYKKRKHANLVDEEILFKISKD